jgi:hypothetical protein
MKIMKEMSWIAKFQPLIPRASIELLQAFGNRRSVYGNR